MRHLLIWHHSVLPGIVKTITLKCSNQALVTLAFAIIKINMIPSLIAMRGLNGHNLFLGLLALLGLGVLVTMDPSGTEEQQRRLAAERQNATHLYQSAGDFARFMQPPAETRSTHTASAYHYFPGHEEPLITASDIDQALQKSPTAAGIKKEIEETESKEEVQE